MTAMKCIICDQRPARTPEGYCPTCATRISAVKSRKREQPQIFLTYRGIVVGLFRNGGDKLRARLLKRNPDYLPKRRTLNLNRYCEGYDRAKIKVFKACCLKLATGH